MKTFLVLCLFVALASASYSHGKRSLFGKCSSEAECEAGQCCLLDKMCFPKIPKYAPCYLEHKHKCGCADGLSCQLTKEISIAGKKIQIRQCMPANEKMTVETLSENDVYDATASRQRRGLFGACSKESDCTGWNQCCLFGKRCAIKIGKYFTCYYVDKHQCGCMDGLTCKVTTTVMLPIVQVAFPIKQCVPKETPEA